VARRFASTRIRPDDGAPSWHALDLADVRRLLRTQPDGLPSAEVAPRLAHHGPNRLEDAPPPGLVTVFVGQFRSPLIYILLAAAVVTLLLGHLVDAAVIAAVLTLNAVIGATQERKAESAVRALMQLAVPRARVVRDGREWEVPSEELVPGDLVLLEPGTRVPADLRLVSDNALHIDESLLTGESLPVRKRSGTVAEEAPLADRRTMAYTGAVVTSGRGRGLVVATGARTELGAIADMIRDEATGETPLQHRMTRFARVIGLAVGVSAAVAFLSGIALGEDIGDMFLVAVALAVAAVPEGLPVVFTITLALGVRRMARRNAIVRRLPAVETLGSTTVIGSDKTGTLTENRMTVQEVWTAGHHIELSGTGADARLAPTADPDGTVRWALHQTLLAGVLTNEAEAYRAGDGFEATGDPTEAALLVAGMLAGIEPDDARDEHPVFAEIPFESERRYSATVRTEADGGHVVYLKGAPERVLEMCSRMITPAGVVPVDPDQVRAAADAMAARGLRVLAMANHRLPTPLRGPDDLDEPEGLVFCGLQGMLDPPRAGVREAIAACHEAGIRVVMITGDHATTAHAIATELGIAAGDAEVLTGVEMARLDDATLLERLPAVSVYARVSPEDKLRIVRGLERLGHVVAVTGDGVNDAPALKAAAIGVAMGRGGTDVARQAADMVLGDDNFVSVQAAVEEGRITFDNVRKVTFFLVSTGAATIVAILGAVWMGWPLLMLPAQLLWLNLVTKGIQDVALAFEPGEPGIRRRPPRAREEGVLSRLLWERTALTALVMGVGTMVLFRWELDRTDSVQLAQTVALTAMVVFSAFHVGNARSETASLLRMSPWSNPFLLVGTVVALALHGAALYLPPTQWVLRVEPIDLAAWTRIVVVSASILVVIEAEKWLRRHVVRGPGDRADRRSARA
jgi:magnesium-transporting ATPase (P-type)